MIEEDTILEFTVPSGDVGRLDAWLATQCEDFSRSRIQGLIKAGRMTINGKECQRGTEKVKEGDVVAAYINDEFFTPKEPKYSLVLFMYSSSIALCISIVAP